MSTPTTAPVKILLVDDIEANLVALDALIAQPEVEILRAISGEAALELLLLHDVALALIDVQMPDMDGFELAELMRGTERTRHVPIIFVTAGGGDARRVFQGYDAGAVDFLFKPVDAHILKHKVLVFVELYRQRQQLASQVELISRLNAELADTLRLNERFVAAVGHDLRTPLNTVLLAAERLAAAIPEGKERSMVDRVRNSAQRMNRMIDELFDLARVRLSGGIPVAPQEGIDLLQVTERAVSELSAVQPERRIEVHHQGDLRGRWDEGRLSQVLSNLLGNALRHGAREGAVRVDIDGNRADEVVLGVENRGEIDAEVLPNLFEPFRRGSAVHTRGDGLGLGLFIVHQVVVAHGGQVHAFCDSGSTRFQVRLPRDGALAAS